MHRIIILGSQGFIGSTLARSFVSDGYNVIGCDLIEYSGTLYQYTKLSILSSDFENIFLDHKFDVCINASGSGNVPFSLNHPLSDFEANSLSVAKVLDTIRKYNPTCKYIHISSAAVYGNPKQLPIKEIDNLLPLSPYGYHKWISEITCQEYHQLYNLPIAILRPFSVYGNGLRKQLLWDLCEKLQYNNSISLFGSGSETRDFIHITDLIQLIKLVIENGTFQCDVYNAASGQETTIKEIAQIFMQCYQDKKVINFSGSVREGDPLNWRADVSKALALGFNTTKKLQNGISEYISWFHSNSTV